MMDMMVNDDGISWLAMAMGDGMGGMALRDGLTSLTRYPVRSGENDDAPEFMLNWCRLRMANMGINDGY